MLFIKEGEEGEIEFFLSFKCRYIQDLLCATWVTPSTFLGGDMDQSIPFTVYTPAKAVLHKNFGLVVAFLKFIVFKKI